MKGDNSESSFCIRKLTKNNRRNPLYAYEIHSKIRRRKDAISKDQRS